MVRLCEPEDGVLLQIQSSWSTPMEISLVVILHFYLFMNKATL